MAVDDRDNCAGRIGPDVEIEVFLERELAIAERLKQHQDPFAFRRDDHRVDISAVCLSYTGLDQRIGDGGIARSRSGGRRGADKISRWIELKEVEVLRVEIDDAEIRVAITTYRMLDLRPLGHLLQKAAGALIRIADVRGDRDGDSQ